MTGTDCELSTRLKVTVLQSVALPARRDFDEGSALVHQNASEQSFGEETDE
jgi:hypothetical protein